MKTILTFNPDNYNIRTCDIDCCNITYRAFEDIQYCRRPVDAVQRMNIYVLEDY